MQKVVTKLLVRTGALSTPRNAHPRNGILAGGIGIAVFFAKRSVCAVTSGRMARRVATAGAVTDAPTAPTAPTAPKQRKPRAPMEEKPATHKEKPAMKPRRSSRKLTAPKGDLCEGVTMVTTQAEAQRVVKQLRGLDKGIVHSIDTEDRVRDINGPNYGDGDLMCFSIYCGDTIDFGGGPKLWVSNMDEEGKLTGIVEEFREYLEDPEIKKVWHNYAFDRAMFWNAGIRVQGLWGDTMHMARLQKSDRTSYKLKDLGREEDLLLGDEDVKGDLENLQKDLGCKTVVELHCHSDQAVRKQWIHYSTMDALATWKLHKKLEEALGRLETKPSESTGVHPLGGTLLDFYRRVWLPFAEILVNIEEIGVPLNKEHLEEQLEKAKASYDMHDLDFRDWVQEETKKRYLDPNKPIPEEQAKQLREIKYSLNHRSLPQMRHLLFGTGVKEFGKPPNTTIGGFGLPPSKKTNTGFQSVDMEVLAELAGEPEKDKCGTAVTQIGKEGCRALRSRLDAMAVLKAQKTYLEPYLDLINEEGRIRTKLNISTDTGRLSSRNPNLQQVPAMDKDIFQIRKGVAPAPGKTFIIADYGQLELRVLAHMSGCTKMMNTLREGKDLHSDTAYHMYDNIQEAVRNGEVVLHDDGSGKPLVKDVFANERRKAKTVNFGIAYGTTEFGLSQRLDIPKEEGIDMIQKWYSVYNEVKVWQENVIREAKLWPIPFVNTLRGRRRYLPELKPQASSSRNRRGIAGHAERQAINSPIQGSAADIVTEAMIKVHRNEDLKKLGFTMILQVHDELLLEGPLENAEAAKSILVELMEHPFLDDFELSVPLPVDAKISATWMEGKAAAPAILFEEPGPELP